MEKKQRTLNNKGFSLIDLIVVIAIMAILVGVLAPQFMKYVESSKQSTDMQAASALRTAIEAYVAENALSGATVITVSTDGTNIDVKDGTSISTDLSAALSEVGLSGSIVCKSTGWPTKDAGSYSCTTYKWTTEETKNTNKPNKDLSDAFK